MLVFARARYFFADVGHWIATHKLIGALLLVVLAGAGAGALLLTREDSSEPRLIGAPAPPVVIPQAPAPEETEDLGFPAFATKNTTRVSGDDPIADAAAVALAVYPSTGGVAGPGAVTLVDADDWQAALAAGSLVAAPIGAPILLSDEGELPELTRAAIRSLAPAGDPETGGSQLFVLGDAVRPDGFDAKAVKGADPAEIAAAIDKLRTRLAGEPEHVLITSDSEPATAMPAAGWAARSGDPVLFVGNDGVPKATSEALARHDNVPVFVLGSQEAIPAKVLKELRKSAASVERVGSEDAAENAIEFARFSSGSFGWNINDPGHGFVIANASRPMDAAIAAPLSASGTWGPLLVTEDAAKPPSPLRGYLLDLKPGYEDDPTRALYNHIWLIGDPSAISIDFQAQVDELAEVAPVRSGSGATTLGPAPGSVESQPGQRDSGRDSGSGNKKRQSKER